MGVASLDGLMFGMGRTRGVGVQRKRDGQGNGTNYECQRSATEMWRVRMLLEQVEKKMKIMILKASEH